MSLINEVVVFAFPNMGKALELAHNVSNTTVVAPVYIFGAKTPLAYIVVDQNLIETLQEALVEGVPK
jgi:hypothetical protein